MKTIITLLLFFALSLTVKSQSWCPPGATWHYAIHQPGDGYSKYTYMYDTIVGTDVCQKIKNEIQGHGMGGFPINYAGYIYTKYQNGVVFKNNGNLNAPHYDTLYCFNCSVGAKWRTQLTDFTGNPNSCSQSFIEVTDTGSTTIQGQLLKWRKIYYENHYGPSMYNGNDTIFERIGTRHSVEFISGGQCADVTDVWVNSFRCYSDAQISMQFSLVDCNYITGITEHENARNLFFVVNPANEKLVGNFKSGNYQLKIFDAVGKQVYSGNHTEQKFSINVASLSNGIYSVQITDKEETITKKIVIQH